MWKEVAWQTSEVFRRVEWFTIWCQTANTPMQSQHGVDFRSLPQERETCICVGTMLKSRYRISFLKARFLDREGHEYSDFTNDCAQKGGTHRRARRGRSERNRRGGFMTCYEVFSAATAVKECCF